MEGRSLEDTHVIDVQGIEFVAEESDHIAITERRKAFADLVEELGGEVLNIDDI